MKLEDIGADLRRVYPAPNDSPPVLQALIDQLNGVPAAAATAKDRKK